MAENVIEAKTRTDQGSAAARRLRRLGDVPGIFYRHGEKSKSFAINAKALLGMVHTESALFDVAFDGQAPEKCVIREIQWDPLSQQPVHVDLMGVSMTEKISVEVPLHLVGISYGVKTEGGIMQQLMREIEIECLPSDIPDNIELDVTELKIGDSLHLSDVHVDKIRVMGDLERPIVTITALRITEEAPATPEAGPAEPELIGKKAEGEKEAEE
jgi:large subunit ribosomal protein L25